MRAILTAALFLTLSGAGPCRANEPIVNGEDKGGEAEYQQKGISGAGGKQKEFEPDEFGNGPFCKGIVIPARDRRYFLKSKELDETAAKLDAAEKRLDAKLAELKMWVARREEFAKRANANLVEIYAAMEPEASAARIAELESELAASLLLAIPPRQSSAILNEMDQKTAASLTSIMAASARKKDPS